MTSVPLLETPVVDLSPLHQGGFDVPRRATYYLVVHHAASHYRQATGPEDVAAFGEWQLGAEGDGDALLRALDATADEEDAALAALDAAGEGE